MSFKQTPEGIVLNQVCEYLTYKKHFFFRVNTIGVYDSVKKIYRNNKWMKKGVADIILLLNGRTIFLEIKSAIGRQSPEQKKFEKDVTKLGCEYYVIHNINELIIVKNI